MSFAGITVSQPAAGSTVGTSTRFVAQATSDTGWPISSMLLYVDDVRVYSTYSGYLDTTVTLATGTRNIAIKSWDDSGKEYDNLFTLNVTSGTTSTSTTSSSAITVSSPTPGSTVGTSVQFSATATSQTGWPISSMLLFVDDVKVYTTYSASLNTTQTLAAGTRNIAIKSWDNSGKEYDSYFTLNVTSTSTTSTSTSAITVSSPTPGSSVGTSVEFIAQATSQTGWPISSMLLFVDDVKVFTTYSSSMDTTQTLATGTRNIAIKSWDNSGKEYDFNFTLNVTSSGTTSTSTTTSGSTVFSSIQGMSGWQSCSSCAGAGGTGPTAPYGLTQHISSPSMDGNSSQFWIGGTTPYSDVLWWRNLVGSSDVTTNSNAHHFVYDLYYYVTDPTAPEAIEFDVDQYVGGRSYIFGSQCDYRGDDQWDVWDNVNSHWISTGISCGTLQAYTWTHVVLEVERTTDNKLHYVSLTLNGSKHYLDWYYSSTATSWSGIDVNYQLDGNYQQQNYSTWVDKMTLTMW